MKARDTHTIDRVLKDFLNNALHEIMSIVGAECGSLFLFDSDHKELVLDSFCNGGSLRLEGLKHKLGEGICGHVARTKKPLLVKDIASDARFHANGFRHYKTNSFICLPLLTSKGLLGIINLADKSSGQSFDENDLRIAATIAKYACLSVAVMMREPTEEEENHKTVLEKYATVGKLATGIVHEINNPLDGIIRYTNILLSQTGQHSCSKEYLAEIKKGLDRIAGITKSLLEFSRQANGNISTAKNYSQVNALVNESLESLSGKINSNITVTRRFAENIPRVQDFGLIHIFTNLIKNAIDAMDGTGTLEITTAENEREVTIAFKDSGCGIAEEAKNRIFEPFFTTKAIDKGTGLGLAICHEIIRKYGGSIEVKSEEGKGSTFTVIIPKSHTENARA